MQNWKTVLRANGQVLVEVEIKQEIFQDDSISRVLFQLFVIALIPLTMLLGREDIGYGFGKISKRLTICSL